MRSFDVGGARKWLVEQKGFLVRMVGWCRRSTKLPAS